jgi:lipoprotein-anchoring transpeptidase ErfK/SrfK
MLRQTLSLLLAFVIVFWIADDPADAHRVKRKGIGKTSLISMSESWHKRNKKKKVAIREVSQTRRKIASSRISIRVSIATQTMVVEQGGQRIATWRISSGVRGFETPRGRYRVGRMHKTYFSRKYDNAPMPNAMFFRGGYAIHGTYSTGKLGRPASHGCIRLHPSNAAKLFAWVRQHGASVQIN